MQLVDFFKTLTLHPKNAQELKGLILQLALRGRFTEKFFLYRNRQKENIVKGYFELPNNWYWDKFDNVCQFQMGKTPPSKDLEYWEGDYPWISIADMETYETIFKTKKTLNDKGLSYFKEGLVKKGTLIMSFKLTIGKTSILGVDACHNEAIISIYPNEKVLQKYLFLFLPIISNWGTQVNALMGNTLNKGKIQNMNLPIPPLEEQKEIVRIVEFLFKEVEQLEQLTVERIALKNDYVTSALQQLTTQNSQKEWQSLQPHFKDFFTEKSTIKKLRETVLQLAVQGKLTADWRSCHPELVSGSNHARELLQRIQKEKAQLIKEKKINKESPLPEITDKEIPYELPEGWVWTNILEISLKVTDGEHATPIRTESGYKLLSARNVTNEGIRLHKVDYVGEEEFQRIRKRCDPQKGDILISCSGSVGRVCLVDKDDEYCMVRSAALVKHHHEHINGMFLCYALRSPILQEQILEKSRSTAQSNLFLGKIKELTFPLPPLEEQKVIVEKVTALMGLCDALEEQITTQKEVLESWMQSVFRGVFENNK